MRDHIDHIEVLRARIDDLLLNLALHDIEWLFDQDEAFDRRLGSLLKAGQIASATALVRWRLK